MNPAPPAQSEPLAQPEPPVPPAPPPPPPPPAPPFTLDPLIYYMIVGVLGLLVLIVAVVAGLMMYNGKDIPQGFLALASSALGGLVGILALPPVAKKK